MTLRSDAYYRVIADETLARIGFTEPPVPIDGLIGALGIPVRPVGLPSFFTAATIYEDGMPVMVVNANQPEPERRRALAHMLAHVLLVMKGETSGYPRDTESHRVADVLALELMVPAKAVTEQAKLWFNDHRYLARLFGVTEAEMLDRMRSLGLVKGMSGVMWDY